MSSNIRHRKHSGSPEQRSTGTISALHSSTSSHPIGTSTPHSSSFTIDDEEDEEEIIFTEEGIPSNPAAATTVEPGENFEHFVPEQKAMSAVWRDLVYSPTFWRFTILTLFLINLNTIFRHLDATLPTYLIRCFGASYPKGIIYSINPFIIMWLTPVIAALTTTSPHYDMIKYGGYVSAISPFFMVMATETWAVVLFVVFLSLGEAIWSPRVYDYTMSIAPEVSSVIWWCDSRLIVYYCLYRILLLFIGSGSLVLRAGRCTTLRCQGAGGTPEWLPSAHLSPGGWQQARWTDFVAYRGSTYFVSAL